MISASAKEFSVVAAAGTGWHFHTRGRTKKGTGAVVVDELLQAVQNLTDDEPF